MSEGAPSPAETAALRAEVAYLRAVLQCACDIIVTTDHQGRIIEWSEGAAKTFGYSRAEVIGKPADMLYIDPAERVALVERLRAQGGPPLADQEVAVRAKDGRKLWLSLSFATLRDAAGVPIGSVGVAKDVTERRRLERELRRLSVTDKLTGLYNQSHFYELLEVEKERAARLGHPLALVLFDLDRFKEWNDARGHDEGDRVLRAVGSVIFGAIRKEVDSGFRYGGDEFCVLLPGTASDGAVVFAERIRSGIERLGIGRVTGSFGVATHERGRQVVKAADVAMYRAKRAGGNRICVDGRKDVAYAGGVAMHVEADVAETA